jgi:hypothetical protein
VENQEYWGLAMNKSNGLPVFHEGVSKLCASLGGDWFAIAHNYRNRKIRLSDFLFLLAGSKDVE